MKILLTGATGYIGKRMLIQLLKEDHHVVCIVRDTYRLKPEQFDAGAGKLEIIA